MRLHTARVLAVIVAALIAVGLMRPRRAADQCAPPGVDSASALPTNLAAAARGPAEDKYTTPRVEPLDSVDLAALGLGTPGHADRRHAVGRAAEHLHQLRGPVHRFRQRTAARGRRQARPEGQLRRHRLLRPAGAGGVAALRRRVVVDHHHRRPPPDRRVHQRLRLRLLLAGRSARLADHGFRRAGRGPTHRRGAGHRAGGLRRRHPAPGPGEVPRLQHRVRQPQDPPDRRVGGAVAAGASAPCRPATRP